MPIVIGQSEVLAIAIRTGQEPLPRPMTHDLLEVIREKHDLVVEDQAVMSERS